MPKFDPNDFNLQKVASPSHLDWPKVVKNFFQEYFGVDTIELEKVYSSSGLEVLGWVVWNQQIAVDYIPVGYTVYTDGEVVVCLP